MTTISPDVQSKQAALRARLPDDTPLGLIDLATMLAWDDEVEYLWVEGFNDAMLGYTRTLTLITDRSYIQISDRPESQIYECTGHVHHWRSCYFERATRKGANDESDPSWSATLSTSSGDGLKTFTITPPILDGLDSRTVVSAIMDRVLTSDH